MLELDWLAVVDRAEVVLSDRNNHGFLLSAEEYLRVWDAMMAMAKQHDVSKLLGLRMASGPAIPVLFAMSSAPDFETGVSRLAVFKNLFGPVQFSLTRTTFEFTVHLVPDLPEITLPASFSSPQIVYLHAKTMTLARHRFLPRLVSLPLPQDERERLADVFGLVPIEGPPILSYTRSDAGIAFVSDNPELWRATAADLEVQALIQSNSLPIADQVRATLLEAFSITEPTLAYVCKRLKLSRSTLLRRLGAENTTFQALLDETRKDLAIRYLVKSDLNNQQIAHLVGYRDPNAFQRAFRKWTGMTPLQLRNSSVV